MQYLRARLLMHVFLFFGVALAAFVLSAPTVLAAPGDFQLELIREQDNQPLVGANVQVNCTGSTNLGDQGGGVYANSLLGTCNNGDTVFLDIVLDGFVAELNVNAGTYNDSQNPDCLLNQNCHEESLQFGLRVEVQDAETSDPVENASVSPELGGSCDELMPGFYYCNEPTGVGCPTTANYDVSASGYESSSDIYDVRCNQTDAQEQVVIALTARPGGSSNTTVLLSPPAAPQCQGGAVVGEEIIWNFLPSDARASGFRVRDAAGTVVATTEPTFSSFADQLFEPLPSGTSSTRSVCAFNQFGETCTPCAAPMGPSTSQFTYVLPDLFPPAGACPIIIDTTGSTFGFSCQQQFASQEAFAITFPGDEPIVIEEDAPPTVGLGEVRDVGEIIVEGDGMIEVQCEDDVGLNRVPGSSLFPDIVLTQETTFTSETSSVIDFAACGTIATRQLGSGERIGLLRSFHLVHGRVPTSDEDWLELFRYATDAPPTLRYATADEGESRARFQTIMNRAVDETNPIDQEMLDRIGYGVLPSQRDLSAERAAISRFISTFGRNPDSTRDWNTVRAYAYRDELGIAEAKDVLERVRSSSEEGPCTEEEIAALNARKAALEAKAAELEGQQSTIKDKIGKLNGEISDLDGEINDLETNSNTKKSEAEALGEQIDGLDAEIESTTSEIAEKMAALTGGSEVSTYSGSDPLGGVSSGAAISFGGGNWVVANGETGAQQLSDSLSAFPGIVEDLQELGNDLRAAEEAKADAEEAKEKAEADAEEMDRQKAEKEGQKAEKEAERDRCQKEFDKLSQLIDELNALIAEFNAVAAKCDIQARAAAKAASERLKEAKRKLDKMPDKEREEAEEDFEAGASEEEVAAFNDPSGAGGPAGGAADDAADKLEEAMRNASGCTDGEKMCGGTYATSREIDRGSETFMQTLLFLRGGGLDADEKYDEMVKDMTDAFDSVDKIDKVGQAIGLGLTALKGESLVGAVGLSLPGFAYGLWSDAAVKAILAEMSALRPTLPNPALEGDMFILGRWIKTQTSTYMETYVCEDGIWQPGPDSLVELKQECSLDDPANVHMKIPVENLPDYSENPDGSFRDPASLTRFSEWRSGVFSEYGEFGHCEELGPFTYEPDC